MKRRENFLPVFFVIVFLCLLILFLSLSGKLNFLSSFLEKGTSGIQAISFDIFHRLPFISLDSRLQKLQDENQELLGRVVEIEKLKKENQALSDQFQTSSIPTNKLLKAEVIGAPGFVPAVSTPNYFILNKGTKDNVKIGQAVILKDSLVGTITQVSNNLSKVNTLNNSSSSFTAKTENGALGVVKGGGSLTLDNVLLSESIKAPQLVLTYGDINLEGVGIPADLVIGKIIQVEKNPSALFQKAKIESFVDFINLSTVFIYL